MPQIASLAPVPRTVYLLGAGFSRAISSRMPLTDELGGLVLRELGVTEYAALKAPQFSPDGLSFEKWFSWLAERQPYESESAYHGRRSQFFSIQELIAGTIRKRQNLVESAGFPRWLYQFVDMLHAEEATVLTLNYDSLVESAYSRMLLTDNHGEVSEVSDITKIFAVSQGGLFGPGPLRANATLDLLKLHGSIDWYWTTGDQTGQSMERAPDTLGLTAVELKTRRAHLAGKQAFIVPPTSSKSDFFDNAKTRFLWQEALRSLDGEPDVVLIGYSLPLNDSALASMLSRSLVESAARVIVVNPDAGSVAKKLIDLGLERARIDEVSGDHCVERFVEDRVQKASAWLASYLAGLSRGRMRAPLAVGWGPGSIAAVEQIDIDPRSKTLTLGAPNLSDVSLLHRPGTMNFDGNSDSANLVLGDLWSAIPAGAAVVSVEARINQNETWQLGGIVDAIPGLMEDSPSGGNENWIVLRPIGQTPRS